jgi:hypothetical protein
MFGTQIRGTNLLITPEKGELKRQDSKKGNGEERKTRVLLVVVKTKRPPQAPLILFRSICQTSLLQTDLRSDLKQLPMDGGDLVRAISVPFSPSRRIPSKFKARLDTLGHSEGTSFLARTVVRSDV